MVMVKIPRCMRWLDTYDEPIGDQDMMEDEVDNPILQSTPQILTSFEEYTLLVTYPKEVENTLGTLIEATNVSSWGYSTQLRAYRVFNKRTRVIMVSIHVNFDELPHMASDQICSDPAPECQRMALEHAIQRQANVPQADRTVVSKSSAVSSADAPNQRQHHTTPLNNHTTPASTYDEFINIFCTPVQDQGKTSSRHLDSSNMHTFYQRYPSEHRWTKDHPLEQVVENPSQSVRTRRQLESDVEMCMFALTEELHQFDRLDVWELVDRPLCTTFINLKWLWKNKRDEKNTVIRNKSRLVAKGYAQKEGVDF
nr:hypothetical protein [Tanacetum cinerariifolium]